MSGSAPSNRPRQTRRVFISSTAVDLRPYRERVRDTLLSLGLFPVGMEHFGAHGTGDATSVSTDMVASADLYLGIVAWRYGYVPHGTARSVTHEEYEEAKRLGLPRYIFLADPATDGPDAPDSLFPAAVRDPEHRVLLEAFRAEIGSAHVVDFFTTPADLAARVATALNSYLVRLKEAELTRGLRPPHELPPPAPEFVGREAELAALCDLVRRGSGAGLAAAVSGMAGVGKSALAAEAVHVVTADADTFPGGVTWVRCDGRAGLPGLTWIYDQLLAAWGISLSPEDLARAPTPAGEVELRERTLRARLGPASDGAPPLAALVFLDNVERDLPIGRALDVFATLGLTALLTARHEPSSPRLRLLPLDVLAPEAATALFAERYSGRGGGWDVGRDRSSAVEVVEALGQLPLAIELAAARAARAHTGVAALAAELREADRLGRLRDPVEPTRSVRYAFEQSLALLNPVRRARFAALGLPDGPEWPRALIEQVLAGVSAGADAAFPAGDDLDLLAALSLVTLLVPDSHREASPRVRLHPLLRDLAREEWTLQSPAIQRACLDALLAGVGALVREHQHDFVALAREEDLIVGALHHGAQEQISPAQVSATIAALDDYLDVGGHWRLGLELTAWQMDAARATGDRTGEGAALNNRGYLAHRLGQMDEAARAYEQARTVRHAVGDRLGEAETLTNLGGLANALGRPDEAERYYEQALAIRRAMGDRAGEATALNNLGLLNDTLGRKEPAADCYRQALSIQQAVGDRRGEATTLNNLGSLVAGLGRQEEAGRYFERALAVQQEIGDRAGEGTTLNNLGALAERLGRTEEAVTHYEQALALRRAVGDRRGEGTTLHNLGALANKLDHKEEAARYFEHALAAEREVGDRAGEGATLSNLGLLARALMRQQEARRYFEQALPVQEEVGDRAGEGATLSNLGLLAFAQGLHDEARHSFERAAALFEEVGATDAARVVHENLAALAADVPLSGTPSPTAPYPAISPPASTTSSVASTRPAEPATPQAGPPEPVVPPAPPARPARRWWPWGR
jgi:tetratricopeptide (TPR) repeat protein